MAGFRSGRGRDSRGAQQHGQYPQHPSGPPYPQQGPGPWQGGGPGPGEPEYFGDPHPPHGAPHGAAPHGGQPGAPQGWHGQDPYANNPGHTQAFSIHDPYGPEGGGPGGPGPYGPDGGYGPQGGGQDGYGYTDGATYHAGNAPAPPSGPRLRWKELLTGIVLRPNATFWQMRDYPVWGPALIVTFVYGLLAVFGLDQAREDVLHTALSQAIPYVLITGVAVVIAGLILGAVTHTLARQFGGDGSWQPTVGLAMLIMSLTDAPRLVFALFLGGTATLVQALGWVTWVFAGVLFTSMVSRSHDLPWPKALGASAIQLLALLFLIKLGTL
ncbi:Yip1 family protein [Streptomyces spirodelae]|uniref:YIP1 family protein n=1 Tax=Streptomyces spirodelae TaxID=2812904 RepID=A0ABS3X2A7_9ACTN|nr:Yip1 family protein [Streptomyces spirodelae]MBO8189468.1 YIP1 family protein [Streptomyces spirodelae]